MHGKVRLGLGGCTWSGQPLASILMVSSTTDAFSSGRMHELSLKAQGPSSLLLKALQLKAQGPSRTCNKSKEEEEGGWG